MEIFRYQFHCCFILGFLVAGFKIRVVFINKKGVFVETPAKFLDNTLLVR